MRKVMRSSKAGLLLSLGTSALAVARAAKQARRTVKGSPGKLGTADAVATVVPVVTSAAMVLRQLRRARRH